MGTQGNDSYIVPSIPMVPNVITTTPRSGTILTPRSQRTMGNVETANQYDNDNDNDTQIDINYDTQQHAEDSIYIDDEDENHDEDDGKNEIEPETPNGPSERKTSEGNVTFS